MGVNKAAYAIRGMEEGGGTASLSGATRTNTGGSLFIPGTYWIAGAPFVLEVLKDPSKGRLPSNLQFFELTQSGNVVQIGREVPLDEVQKRLLHGNINVMPQEQFQQQFGDDTQPSADTGGISASSSQEAFAPLTPPVLDILDRLQARRQAVRDAALANFSAVAQAAPIMAPQGAKFFPGFEPGGIADIMFAQSAGRQPVQDPFASYRAPGRVALPGLPSPYEPAVGEEFGGALDLAKIILSAIQSFQTGRASSTQTGGTSTTGPTPDEVLMQGISALLGCQ